MPPTTISSIQSFSPYINKLHSLGYYTFDDLVYGAQAAGRELEMYLGADVDALVAAAQSSGASASIPSAEVLNALKERPYVFGAAIDRAPRFMFAPFSSPFEDLPEKVDHSDKLPPIEDQGNRGTCVAFATLSAYTFVLKSNGSPSDLSEQFLYWNCKQHDGIPNRDETYIYVAAQWLNYQGACSEDRWHYNPDPILGNIAQSPPPGAAAQEAASFRSPPFQILSANSVGDLKYKISQGKLVPFTVPVFGSWANNLMVIQSGNITMPVPGEVRLGGHAMCIVGYQDNATEKEIGGGRFIIRNSWGSRWSTNSIRGCSYGTIPYAYLTKFGVEAAAFG